MNAKSFAAMAVSGNPESWKNHQWNEPWTCCGEDRSVRQLWAGWATAITTARRMSSGNAAVTL